MQEIIVHSEGYCRQAVAKYIVLFADNLTRSDNCLMTCTATHAVLLANSNPLLDGAVLADDVAAPVEATMAAVSSSLLDDVVSATAAEGTTAVNTRASAVTLSSSRAREVNTRISLTEVRGALIVEEIQC